MPVLKQHSVRYYFIVIQYLLKLILSAIFYKAQWTASNRASLYLPRFDCWLFIFCAMHSAWRHYSLACLDSAAPTEPRMSSVCSDLLTVAAKSNAWIKYFVQWFSLLQWTACLGSQECFNSALSPIVHMWTWKVQKSVKYKHCWVGAVDFMPPPPQHTCWRPDAIHLFPSLWLIAHLWWLPWALNWVFLLGSVWSSVLKTGPDAAFWKA